MWSMFCLAVLAIIAIVYIPGFFFLRSISFSALISLACAPIVSIVAYEVLGIVYAKVGIGGSWLTIFLPPAIFAIILFIRKLFLYEKKKDSFPQFDWINYLIYIVVAVCVAMFYFVLPLNGAGSFSQESDNTAHLGYIQSFLSSGNYSTLDASLYHGIADQYESPTGSEGGVFYPTAWHCVAALGGSITGASVPLAANAALFVFVAVVFPSCAFLLITVLANGSRLFVASGSVVVLGFAAFPWGMLTFGPLYPNFSSFSLVPAMMAVFLLAWETKANHAQRIKYAGLFLIGLIALALLQTNAMFTTGVLLIPFCTLLVWQWGGGKVRKISRKPIVQGISAFLFIIIILIVWYIAYKLPFMQSVVGFSWEPFTSVRQAIVNIVLLSYGGSPAQPFLAFLVGLGGLYCLVKQKNRWLVVSYVLACVLCLITSAFSGDIRSFFTGFWYTDSYRVAAMVALAGIPLATYGSYAFVCLLNRIWVWAKKVVGLDARGKISQFRLAIFYTCFAAMIYYPSFSILGTSDIKTAFGAFETRWHDTNHATQICIMDEDEEKFVAEVSEIVDEDELIFNKPDDGSVFAYGAFGVDIYYRRTGVAAIGAESDDSKLVRLQLDEYAINDGVQEAVTRSGAKYLLVLDQGFDDERYWFGHYRESEWVGIDAVTDDTPGFKVVLAEGDMRLYEILPVN